ncbi:hypothetical protein, partial [Streptomyces sp. NPDC059787]|uniref:hypothetical protein n=1 Tax=Streptomyces sp. NPDC059787 TaxID=3346947 RepID=UPI00364644A7
LRRAIPSSLAQHRFQGLPYKQIPFRVQDTNTQALLCLTRRRADVFFAMPRDGTFYEPQPAAAR